MNQLVQIGESLLVAFIVIYALLLMIGAPFGGPKVLANPFAKWVGSVLIGVAKLPFLMASKALFRKKQKKKKKKRRWS